MSIDLQTLPADAEALKKLCTSQAHEITFLRKDIEALEEMLRLLRIGRYGAKSEQMAHPGMQSLFPDQGAEAADETDNSEDDATPVKGHTRKPVTRKPFPDHLRREDIRVDISDEEKKCDCCGTGEELKTVSEQITEKLHVKPSESVVHRFIRPVYSCRKCEAMKVAPMPSHPIPKCSVTTETLSHIAVSKYLDGLPLYRQEQIFLRGGIDIGRDKMSRWIVQLGEKLAPVAAILHKRLMSEPQICMDETTMQVLKEENRLATAKSFMIVQAKWDPGGRSIALFHYSPSRSRDAMEPLLKGFQGILLTDGLGVYDGFGISLPGVVHAGCWSHARRKFVEAQRGSKVTSRKGSLASHGVDLIDQLFAIEAECAHLSDDERKTTRNERSRPIIEALRAWLDSKVDTSPQKSLIGKAMRYTLGQWPKLIKFLDDGRIPLHNNFVENMIRPFAVGRKNWLFSDTPEGAEANAVLYSLLVTAKINGLHPGDYLSAVLKGIGQVETTADLLALLPFKPLH